MEKFASIFFLYLLFFSISNAADLHFPDLQKESHTFEGNLATFLPRNSFIKKNKLYLKLTKTNNKYYGAEVTVKNKKFLRGRFEAKMKPACIPGSITGFFLYRYNPWQEIDIEFLGKDFSKIQTSIIMNAGNLGAPQNFPNYTPKFFDLGFNACDKEHTYTIVWDETEVRFYVDQKLIDTRANNIPNLPLELKSNVWLNSDSNWVGTIQDNLFPANAIFSYLNYNNSHKL